MPWKLQHNHILFRSFTLKSPELLSLGVTDYSFEAPKQKWNALFNTCVEASSLDITYFHNVLINNKLELFVFNFYEIFYHLF